MKKSILVMISIFMISFLNIKAEVKTFYKNMCEDTTIKEEWPTQSQGGSTSTGVADAPGSSWRVLIKFKDIISSTNIPLGSNISFATLKMYHYTSEVGSPIIPGKIEVYRILKDWGEGTLSNTGEQANAACWNSPKFNLAQNWEVAGCNGVTDRTQVPDDTIDVNTSTANFTDYTINITKSVQAWVNGAPNYGVILIPTQGLLGESNKPYAFTSSEDGSNNANRPQMTVEYSASRVEDTNWGKVKNIFR